MQFEKYQFPSRRSNVVARNGLVATSQPLAAQAGLSVLQAGGNAIDAAIATVATLCVVEPCSTGVGGDAFALIWSAKDKKLYGLNASGPAPAALTSNDFLDEDGRPVPGLSLESGLAVDTTALIAQPLFAGLRNPFFDNLRVDVDLSVPRGSWLRSIDSDVEMSGDLLVRYDRRAGDFVLIGELEAQRPDRIRHVTALEGNQGDLRGRIDAQLGHDHPAAGDAPSGAGLYHFACRRHRQSFLYHPVSYRARR